MSTATAEPEMTTTTPEPERGPEPERPNRWARYVHVGDGAADCPDNGADCTNPDHMHAWLRVVNPFVRDELREQASAARARRLRQFRDPDSNSSVILDGELEDLRGLAEREGSTRALIEACLVKDLAVRQRDAMREAREEEDFEHVGVDETRFFELADMPGDERPADEFDELDRTLTAYRKRVAELREQAEVPLREALADRTIGELLSIVRQDRIAAEGTEAFFETWVRANVAAGTFKVAPGGKRPTEPMFASSADLAGLTPEEAATLRGTFMLLESEFSVGLGNS